MKAREVLLEETAEGPGLRLVVATILSGGVVAYPAEAMYGIGGDGLSADVAARLAAAKGSPADRPFLVLIDEAGRWRQVASAFPAEARRLASVHWPGPLTLLLPAAEGAVAARSGKVAVRVPDLPIVRRWVREADRPIFSTSANKTGEEPVRTPEDLRRRFGEWADLLITGPVFRAGEEPSTIVDATVSPARLVRRGAVPFPDRGEPE